MTDEQRPSGSIPRRGGTSGPPAPYLGGDGHANPDAVPLACPLSPALRELLQAAALGGDRCDCALAAQLHRSRHMVKTEWKHIREVLGVHSRAEALLKALRHGWVHLHPHDLDDDGA